MSYNPALALPHVRGPYKRKPRCIRGHLLEGDNLAVCRDVCKSGRKLAVDHDHRTQRVRGLLCSNCNNGIGRFGDKPELLLAAMKYLTEQNG